MRDPEIIETELMEIGAIADDTLKFERIIAWCASHPDEVPFALHQFMGRRDKHPLAETNCGTVAPRRGPLRAPRLGP
jgi:hypothetical protein